MYSNEKHRENGIFDIILSVVFYIMIFCAPFVDVVVNGQIAETKTLAGFLKEHSDNTVSLILNIFPVFSDRDIEIHFFQAFLPLCAGCVRFV